MSRGSMANALNVSFMTTHTLRLLLLLLLLCLSLGILPTVCCNMESRSDAWKLA
jgi:hypothetical protein